MVLLMVCIAGQSPQILNLSVLNYWNHFVHQWYYMPQKLQIPKSLIWRC